MEFTIDHLIKTKPFIGMKLIAGKKGLQNVIGNVNIMDNPDSFGWLTPGDLVLTTGFVFKDDPQSQRNVIKELADINCSGLMIKTHKYFGEMPQLLIDEANKYNLPLISAPQEYSLAQLILAINKKILNTQDSIFQKTLYFHERLSEISLYGGGLDEIAKDIVSSIKNPIIIVSSNWSPLAYVDHPENKYPLNKCLNFEKNRRIFPKENIDSIPQDVMRFKKSIKIDVKCEGSEEPITCRIMAVVVNTVIYGYLVVWETVSKMSRMDYVYLEKAASVVAFERLKAKEIEEARHQIRKDFFDDLLSGNMESNTGVKGLADLHQLDISKKYCCAIIKNNDVEFMEDDFLSYKRRLTQSIDTVIRTLEEVSFRYSIGTMSITRGNQVIAFIPVHKDLNRNGANKLIKNLCFDVLKRLENAQELQSYQIGIGKVHNEIIHLNRSYLEAIEAIELGKKVYPEEKVFHYEDLLIYRLLGKESHNEELTHLFERTVKDLYEFDKANDSNLLETLEEYFASQGNISEAAKKMYLHRNTFMYRMEKIKEILKRDLKDSEELLELQIGLKAFHMLKIH